VQNIRHILFVYLLALIGLTAILILSFNGWSYYKIPLELRPFNSNYGTMKPSGIYSHGLGIIGTAMVIIGVITYTSRKRFRALRNIGSLSYWLEFHIFLCFVGPVFVVFHTTFKASGIASIALWTMSAVVASGLIGRFLYVQIPRNINGTELTIDEINNEMQQVGLLLQKYPVGILLNTLIDKSFATLKTPKSFWETISCLVRLELIKLKTRGKIREVLSWNKIPGDIGTQLRAAALSRAALMQKSLLLAQIERLLFYWHAVHLPFTIIMFIALTAHIIVAILLGYRWIF
jgi:hypothetical protein